MPVTRRGRRKGVPKAGGLPRTKTHGKYHNQKTIYKGETYDSRGEADLARDFDHRVAAGLLFGWLRGRPWLLLDGPTRSARVYYIPDFEVWFSPVVFTVSVAKKRRKGKVVEVKTVTPSRPPDAVVDHKGMRTPVFNLKAKFFKDKYPDVPLVLHTTDGSYLQL